MKRSARLCFLFFVVASVVVSVVSPCLAASAVAVSEVKSPDGFQPANLSGIVSETLRSEFAQSDDIAIFPERSLPVGGDCWRVRGSIVVAKAEPQETTVEVAAELVPTVPNKERVSVQEKGVASAAPGKAVTQEELYAQAGRAAARRVVQRLRLGLLTKGVVFRFIGRTQQIEITLGADHNLRRTAELAVMRGSQRIARAEVIESRPMDAAAKLTWTAPGQAPQPGDVVLVLKNGPLSAFKEDLAREQRKKNLGAFLAAAAMGLIAAQ